MSLLIFAFKAVEPIRIIFSESWSIKGKSRESKGNRQFEKGRNGKIEIISIVRGKLFTAHFHRHCGVSASINRNFTPPRAVPHHNHVVGY